MNKTRYSDYPKYNQLISLMAKNESKIKSAYKDPHINGDKGIVPLSDELQELKRKIGRTKGAIDDVNRTLSQYGDYIAKFDIEPLDEGDYDDEIIMSMLATIYINPIKIRDKTLQGVSDMIKHINSNEYITTISNIGLPLPKDDEDLDGASYSECLEASVFIDDTPHFLEINGGM